MLKKRIIAVVVVKNGIAVQSFGYKKYMPIGNPLNLIENFDRWGADEILVHVIDRSVNNSGPDFDLIKSIASLRLETPIIYGGGISSVDEGIKAIHLGADRLSIDTLLYNNLSVCSQLSDKLGKQALIGSIPVFESEKKLSRYNYIDAKFNGIDKSFFGQIVNDAIVSEFLLMDVINDGFRDSFNERLPDYFKEYNIPVICFGGISEDEQVIKILNKGNVSSVAIGNFLNYSENAIQKYKHTSNMVRSAKYFRSSKRTL